MSNLEQLKSLYPKETIQPLQRVLTPDVPLTEDQIRIIRHLREQAKKAEGTVTEDNGLCSDGSPFPLF